MSRRQWLVQLLVNPAWLSGVSEFLGVKFENVDPHAMLHLDFAQICCATLLRNTLASDEHALLPWQVMTLDELDREYTTLRQQADAVRSYL